MSSYIVYMHRNKINNKAYIGCTKLPINERFQQHITAANAMSPYPFHRALRKYGSRNWVSTVLYQCFDETTAYAAESELISTYNTYANNAGYNATIGGDRGPILHGKDNGMFGKTHTPEVKARLSKLAKDRYTGISYEDRHGTDKAIELKAKRSEDMKRIKSETPPTGTNNSNAKCYALQDPNGNTYVVEGSIQRFCKEHNMWVGGIIAVAKGRRESFKGWTVISVTTVH